MRAKGALLAFLTMLLFGCSLDYHSAEAGGNSIGEIPDTILYNFTTNSVRGKQPYFRIKAAEAETFDKKNITIFTKVSFQEFNSAGKVVARGTADRAVYHADTKNAELSGNIDVYSTREKAQITTNYLFWNNDNKTLTGKPNVPVKIVKDDGSKIDGSGFDANLRTRSIQFSSNVRGSFVETHNK